MPAPLVAAAGVTAAVGIGGSILSAKAQKKAAKKAAKAQVKSAQMNIDFQKEVFNTIREDQAPWREIGATALKDLQAGMADGSFDIAKFDFTADPGYQFRLAEGQKALDHSAAARGNLLSGAQLKAATRYGQEFAANEYQSVFNRNALAKGTRFNQGAALAGVGQTAVAQTNAAGMHMGANVGNAMMAQGNAQANAALASGQAQANMWGNIANSINSGIGNMLIGAA